MTIADWSMFREILTFRNISISLCQPVEIFGKFPGDLEWFLRCIFNLRGVGLEADMGGTYS